MPPSAAPIDRRDLPVHNAAQDQILYPAGTNRLGDEILVDSFLTLYVDKKTREVIGVMFGNLRNYWFTSMPSTARGAKVPMKQIITHVHENQGGQMWFRAGHTVNDHKNFYLLATAFVGETIVDLTPP